MAPSILTINGGSSSIKFALFAPGEKLERLLEGQIERIGQSDAKLTGKSSDGKSHEQSIDAADHVQAAHRLMDWLWSQGGADSLAGIAHRIVHGGVHLVDHQLLTPSVLQELRKVEPLDLAHLPGEIALIEAFGERFKNVPQIACFDTAFHHDMPRLARLLPVPRKYDEAGL